MKHTVRAHLIRVHGLERSLKAFRDRNRRQLYKRNDIAQKKIPQNQKCGRKCNPRML